MIGIIVNVLSVGLGGLVGALCGRRLPEHFRTGLNAIFGICAMGMGISSITLMENMPAVIMAVILGTSVGLLIHLGDRITASGNLLQKAMEKTAGNTRLSLVLALSYSGRSEIVDVAKSIAREAAAGTLNPDNIDETTIQQHLYHPEIPDVDLMIRTGGDMRVSNFLLWEIAYAELFFTPVLWPDFRKENLREIVTQFSSRERRFGKTGEQVRAH